MTTTTGQPAPLPNGGVDAFGRCLTCGKKVESSAGCHCHVVLVGAVRSPYEITQSLLAAAIVATQDLVEHCKTVHDQPRMRKARRALHELEEVL